MVALRLPRFPRPASPRRTLRERARSLAAATARVLRFPSRVTPDQERRAMMAGALAFAVAAVAPALAASPALALGLDAPPPVDPVFAAIQRHRDALAANIEAMTARDAFSQVEYDERLFSPPRIIIDDAPDGSEITARSVEEIRDYFAAKMRAPGLTPEEVAELRGACAHALRVCRRVHREYWAKCDAIGLTAAREAADAGQQAYCDAWDALLNTMPTTLAGWAAFACYADDEATAHLGDDGHAEALNALARLLERAAGA